MSCGGTTGSDQPVHQQLAAALERAHVAIDRGHERHLLLGVGEVALPVDGAEVPVRIVEQST